jgi:cytochrome oxidase Cu insertion factor (SCO1/SenC/PrrC family)
VPGMNSGLSPSDPTLVTAFRNALLHQGLIALAFMVFLLLVWATARTWRGSSQGTAEQQAAAGQQAGTDTQATAEQPATQEKQERQGRQDWRGWLSAVRGPGEAPARTVLRVGFGLLWVLDGFLQAQPQMAGGLPGQVIEPAAQGSPGWVQHLVNWGGTVWSYHPIEAGAATVWIQLGIGAWMLVATRGPLSRLAGLAGLGWGLVVWVFGEAFGSIMAPGLTFLFGAPGAVLFYVVAGGLLALPDRAWTGKRLGLALLRGTGVFFVGMAVLQAWPGRGFWQGGSNGSLSGMIQSMVTTPQPHALKSIVSGAESFTSAHGWGVNLFAVISMAAIGVLFLTGRPRLVRYGLWYGVFFCLADWVLVEDLGFFGGLGTDPNSMLPIILLFTGGYLALITDAVPQAAPAARAIPATLTGKLASARAQTLAIASAVIVIIIGTAPLAAAAVNPNADPIIAQSISGDSGLLDVPEYPLQLTDQNGRQVSLASLRGKVVLLTFLDPVCTTDCPIIGAEFKQAGVLLGADDKKVELVAVVANPTYTSIAVMRAYDAEIGLTSTPNWLYLTGTLAQLRHAWDQYGITVENLPAGAMTAHNDIAFVISPKGQILQELNFDPGPATTGSESSYSVLLANYARKAMAGS